MLTLVLIAVVSPQGAHWDAMAQANETATVCSVRQGVRLDDKRTSPEIVARAAMAACNRELVALDQSIATNAAIEIPAIPQEQRDAAVQGHIQSMRKRIEDLIVQAVLERRVRNAPNQ